MDQDALVRLQAWYYAQCDEDWEHGYRISISTLDNPGWLLSIDLTGTDLADRPFETVGYGLSEPDGKDWLSCSKEVDDVMGTPVFRAAGGPFKLKEMIETFLRWAEI